MSVGTVTEDVVNSFTEKTMDKSGDTAWTTELTRTGGLGFTCRKGLKPESPNQDSFSILKIENEVSVYGVYDGHGKKGHDSSEFVKHHLPQIVCSDKRFKTDSSACLGDGFLKAQGLVITADEMKHISAQLSGTTVTMVVHEHLKDRLIFSHCADSTAVLGGWADDTKSALEVVYKTRDHKPDLDDENARIRKAGGTVKFDGYTNHRVYAAGQRYPGLNMSRCMGDLKGHFECGLTAEPEVRVIDIMPEHHVLLVCSDGVWEFMEPEEVVEFVGRQPPANAMNTAHQLAKMAWDRWIQEEDGEVVDDITVILVYLNIDK
jgi:serine/threonine protein phosphatase PrpC